MNPAKTSGAGYNDPDKLKAAMELAQSFKKGPLKGSSSGKRSPSSGRSDLHQRTPPNVHRPTITSSVLPPPSQRKYTDTLVSDPSQILSGPIVGSKAWEFLCRQDQKAKPQKLTTTSEPQKTTVAVSGTSTIQASNGVKNNPNQLQDDETAQNPHSPVSTVVDQVKASSGYKSSALIPLASQTDQKLTQLSQPSVSFMSQGRQSQIGPKAVAKDNILDTFLSLMDQGSELSKGAFSTATTKKSFAENSPAPHEKVEGSVLGSPNFEKKNASCPLNQEIASSTSTSPQTHTGGKTIGRDEQTDQRLRPNAPEFRPEQVTLGVTGRGVDVVMPSVAMDDLPPKVPTLVPIEQSPLQSADVVMQTGPAHGHVISVTQVHFADGFIMPGATTGQLWLQTPVAVDPGATASAHNPATSGTLQSSNYSATATPAGTASSQKLGTERRKPTVGLKGSRWA